MQCPKCQHENPTDFAFCEECASPFGCTCSSCGTTASPAAKFCGKCAALLAPGEEATRPATKRAPRSYTPKHLADKILSGRSALEGERKQVTALFADIKGSMELIEGLDPEEAHRVLEPVLQLMMDAVHHYEGYVVQSPGDGIFALFGAPIADEDHANRAVKAALLMQQDAAKLAERCRASGTTPIQIRVGLNSGEVVIRSIRKTDLYTEYTSIGHATGIAARMESLATPGSILISEHTQKLTEGYFRLRALGEAKVKGVSEPVRIFEVTGASPERTRLEVAAKRGLVRFVGRQRELEQMRIALDSTEQGHGQIVAIMGEAGVGKSRLLYEFKAAVPPGCLVMEAHSVSHAKTSSYLPLIELLKRYFEIGDQDDEQTKRDKVTQKVLALDPKLEGTPPYLFALLGILEPTSSLRQMDPQIRRQRTLDAVKALLVRESLKQPLVLMFEDLHWIDTETQAFLDVMVDGLATAQILLLVSARPEYEHGWASKTYYNHVRVDSLGTEEAQELLTALVGNGTRAALQPLKKLIMERTEGNPFFMEEAVKMLAEEDVLSGERGSYRLERSPSELHIPATVQAVLASRIDRQGAEEKELLQTLAVIGREFPLGLVRRVVGQPNGSLPSLLAHLQAAEFIYEQPAFPEPDYSFKHALTHDVAYHTVLVERRKVMHERAARAIEHLYRSALDAHYGELARHYSRTDDAEKAVEYLHLAGQQAVERSAYKQAIDHLTKALELVATMPETTERNEQELLLQTALGPAFMATEGFAAAEVEQAYGRARDLCERVGETPQLFQALLGLAGFHLVRAEHRMAHELGEQLVSLAESTQDVGLSLVARGFAGGALNYLGELSGARGHWERAIALYDPKQHHPLASVYTGHDVGVQCLSIAAFTLALLGFPAQALTRAQEAVRLAEELSHPFSLATALTRVGLVHVLLGDWRAVQENGEAAITISTEHGFPLFIAGGAYLQALALVQQGPTEERIEQMRQVVDSFQAVGANLVLPFMLAFLAESYGKVGLSSQGLGVIADALELVEKTGERWSDALIYRIRGELLLLESKDEKAERSFQQAIEVARRQSAKWWELRASASLARLWQKQGKKEEARKLLSEIYGWFTEGFDATDLRDAKALLDELR